MHAHCIGIESKAYKAMQSCVRFNVFCDSCDTFFKCVQGGLKVKANDVRKNPESLRSVLLTLCKPVSELSEIDSSISKAQVDAIHGEVKSTYADIVKAVKSEIQEIKKEIKPTVPASEVAVSKVQVMSILNENREKEKRKFNVILHNIPESKAPESATKVKDDTAKAFEIFEAIGVNNVTIDRIVRLGKPDTQPGKMRLLLVDVGDVKVKEMLLRRAPNLKRNENLSKFFITEDKTPEEQKFFRELVKQRDQKRKDEPDYNHFIRDNKIVSTKKAANVDGLAAHPSTSANPSTSSSSLPTDPKNPQDPGMKGMRPPPHT